jgi:hypothetical protein
VVSRSGKQGIPPKLKKDWKKLQLVYFHDKFGEYYPQISKKGEESVGWVMYCVPCSKEFVPQLCDNLQNFLNHLKPKGGNEKNVHEIALLSKTTTQNAIEEKDLKEATTQERRKGWVEKHNQVV